MSMKKIAHLTGTSVATVSRVLNNPDYHCNDPKLSEKIWQAAKELNYTPNTFARDLRKGTIANNNPYVVDVFLARFNSIEQDLFFKELFQHVKEELLINNCLLGSVLNSVDVMELFEKPSEQSEVVPFKSVTALKSEKDSNKLAFIERKKNTGLLILGKCPRELIDVLKRRYAAIAGIDRNPTDYKYDEAVCNGTTAAQKAMEYLISLGHSNIAYIGDCNFESRYIGYYQSLLDNKIPLNHNNVYPSNQTMEEGFDIMNSIISSHNRPTAIFCANDCTAIGVLKALKKSKKRGYKPSVISIDNIEQSQSTSPMLTTINIPKKEMVHFALNLLLDRKNKLHSETVRMELPCNLVIRESCTYV